MAAIVPVKIVRAAARLPRWCFSFSLFVRSTLKKCCSEATTTKKKTSNARHRCTFTWLQWAKGGAQFSHSAVKLVVTRGARTAYVKSKSSEGQVFTSGHQSRRGYVFAILWHFINVRRLFGLVSQRRGNFSLPPDCVSSSSFYLLLRQ